ncbi:hypothetical protein B0H14DRAFT_3520721 [Mycena olivaceomarginata]|nr:hypothetical protein B0H14DRAFT_3520721 [Mycena olivaceomarginata]
MALALDLGRFGALDTKHPSTEADDLPGLETAAPADGVLFSTVRSTSINSAPQLSQRSVSLLAECNYVSPAPPPLAYKSSTERCRSTLSLLPLPESVRIQLPGISPNSSAELDS